MKISRQKMNAVAGTTILSTPVIAAPSLAALMTGSIEPQTLPLSTFLKVRAASNILKAKTDKLGKVKVPTAPTEVNSTNITVAEMLKKLKEEGSEIETDRLSLEPRLSGKEGGTHEKAEAVFKIAEDALAPDKEAELKTLQGELLDKIADLETAETTVDRERATANLVLKQVDMKAKVTALDKIANDISEIAAKVDDAISLDASLRKDIPAFNEMVKEAIKKEKADAVAKAKAAKAKE